MKLFRNPWVAGSVGLLAVAVVFYVVLLPRLGHNKGAKDSQSSVAGNASKGASSVEAPAPKTAPPPTMQIDRAYAQMHYPGWISGPSRDPFQMIGAPVLVAGGPAALSPVLSWKLKAIWRQTGGNIAAINTGVFGEGDDVQGYKIDRIEGDRVWFHGPAGPESLDFEKHDIAAVTTPKGTNIIERLLGPEQSDPIRPRL